MPILQAIILGIVQGVSEFLPISSSGHLELTRWLFGWDALPEEARDRVRRVGSPGDARGCHRLPLAET